MGTQASAEDLDLLEYISVSVPCTACGQHYDVNLRQVLLSHEMLHQGCPVGSDTECPQLTYAALANEAVLRDFERSWTRLLHQARTTGFDLAVSRPTLTH